MAAQLADKEAVISDLRWRLDRADEQRQQAQIQLAALLADQRPPPRAPEPPRKGRQRFMVWRRRPA